MKQPEWAPTWKTLESAAKHGPGFGRVLQFAAHRPPLFFFDTLPF